METKAPNPYTEEQTAQLDEHFAKALTALTDVQRMMNDSGILPPALASASCAAFVTYVSAMSMLMGVDRGAVIGFCQGAVGSMAEYVDDIYEKMEQAQKKAQE